MREAMSPLISVIIPTHNRAQLLPRAVSSVLGQTHGNLELIIVDDGSTDNTSEIVKRFKDPRILYLCHKVSRGAPAARNTGIQRAKGEYIAFLDDDDEWLPHKLERQLDALFQLHRKAGVAYCKYKKLYPNAKARIGGERFGQRRLLHHNFITTSSLLVRRECLDADRFDESLPRGQDWELCLRLSQRYEFVFVDEVLVLAGATPGSIGTNKHSLLRAYQMILDKHYRLIRKSPRALGTFHYTIGSLLAKEKQWQAARTHLLRSALCWPFDPKHWARWLAIVCGKSVYCRFFGTR